MNDVIMFISFLLGAGWRFFAETTVPGFQFTVGQLFIAYFLANLGLRLLFSMLGMRISADTVGHGISHFKKDGEKK